MKIWRAGFGILVGADLEKDWYFEPGFNVTLETTKGKFWDTVSRIPLFRFLILKLTERMNSGQNHVTTSWLKERFTSFDPPVIDEETNTVRLVDNFTFIDRSGYQVENQKFFVTKNGRRPLYPNIVGCRNPDTLAEMMEDWRSKINEHYEIEVSGGIISDPVEPNTTSWDNCEEDCFSKLLRDEMR